VSFQRVKKQILKNLIQSHTYLRLLVGHKGSDLREEQHLDLKNYMMSSLENRMKLIDIILLFI
jgi:hypothetical protein